MKRMTAAATLIALLTIGTQAVAQDDRAVKAQQQMQQTIARLDLTDEQVDQVTPVLEEAMAARQKILSSYGIDLASRESSAGSIGRRQTMVMRKELNVVRADTRSELEQILSDEQLAEFERVQQERRAEMRERIRGAR